MNLLDKHKQKESLGQVNICALIPTYKRKKITVETILRIQNQTLPPKNIVVVGSCREDQEAAELGKAHYLEVSNEPLGAKVQAGIECCKKFNPDAILLCGSDDWLSSNWIEVLSPYLKKYDLIGSSHLYLMRFMEEEKIEVARCSYEHTSRVNEPMGPGRLISKKILDKIGWKLYSESIRSGLDGNSFRKLLGSRCKVFVYKGDQGKMLCPKGDWKSLNPWGRYVNNSDILPNSKLWLDQNFPDAISKMQEITGSVVAEEQVTASNNCKKGVAYFSSGLGNFVMMIPALRAMASLTEDGTIDLCFREEWKDSRRPPIKEICAKIGFIKKIISYPKDKFDPRKYGLWFYSSHGVGCDVVGIFVQKMGDKYVLKPSWRSSFIHEADHYMDVAYAMGYVGKVPEVGFPLADNPVLNLKRPIVALCNGAFKTSYWEKKHWPYFKSLSSVLKRWTGCSIVGVGSEGELRDVSTDMDFTGKLSITQTAKVLSQCDLLITTDTGNMHIADVLKIPLIALFGSTLVSKNGPRNKDSSVLMTGIECAPCQDTSKFSTCENNLCMKSILVGDVVALAREKLRRKP